MFFVSSVHKRKILSVDHKGVTKTFATRQQGLWSVLGMKVDAVRRHLWVTSSAFPQMENFKKEEEGSSGVFKFDLRSGRLIKRYLLPNAPRRHALGDQGGVGRKPVRAAPHGPAVALLRPPRDRRRARRALHDLPGLRALRPAKGPALDVTP